MAEETQRPYGRPFSCRPKVRSKWEKDRRNSGACIDYYAASATSAACAAARMRTVLKRASFGLAAGGALGSNSPKRSGPPS